MNGKVKLLVICGVVIAGIGLVLSSTFAFYRTKDNVVNNFSVGKYETEIEEEFDKDTPWNGSLRTKVVSIKNNGTRECLVRVAIILRWVDENNNPFIGDTSFIKLNYSEFFTDKPEFIKPGSEYWVNGGDGYYYYLDKVVPQGVTKPLLKSVGEESGQIPLEYKGKTLIVDVKSETVQATRFHDGSYQFEENWLHLNDSVKSILVNIVDK